MDNCNICGQPDPYHCRECHETNGEHKAEHLDADPITSGLRWEGEEIARPPQPDIPYSMHYDKRVLVGPHGALEAIVISIVPDPDADPILFAIRAEDWYAFAVSSAAFTETEFKLDGSHRKRVGVKDVRWSPPV